MTYHVDGEHLSVDRIENGIAVLEEHDGGILEIPVSELPPGVREGDCLLRGNGGFSIDRDETDRRRKRNIELFNSLLDGGNL